MVLRGPEVYRLTALEAAIAAGKIDVPKKGPAATFTFPRDVIVESIFAQVLSGDAADLAGLEIGIFDHHEREVVTDGQTALFVSARALVGAKHRWFPLEIPIRARERWRVRVQNVGPNAITPSVYLRIRDAA